MRIAHRLVIDTNVVLDFFHFHRPGLARLVDAIASGGALCFACARTLKELQIVLARPHFGLDEAGVQAMFEGYAARVITVADPPDYAILPRCKDTADQKFIELAYSVSADALLTRDKALLKLAKRVAKVSRMKITTPERFLGDGVFGGV